MEIGVLRRRRKPCRAVRLRQTVEVLLQEPSEVANPSLLSPGLVPRVESESEPDKGGNWHVDSVRWAAGAWAGTGVGEGQQ